MAQLSETAELVVSELVTNAVRATSDGDSIPARPALPVVHLRLLSDHVRLVIEVWDTSPQQPVAKSPGDDDESGRGLMLVEAFCDHWGTQTTPTWPGKVVWAELQQP